MLRYCCFPICAGLVTTLLLGPLTTVAIAQEQAPADAPPNQELPPEPVSDTEGELTWIGYQHLQDAARVFVRTTGKTTYHVTWQGKKKLVLELFNTIVLSQNHLRPLDTRFFDSPVMLIKALPIEAVSPTVRIEVNVRNKGPYQVKQEDNLIFIDFKR